MGDTTRPRGELTHSGTLSLQNELLPACSRGTADLQLHIHTERNRSSVILINAATFIAGIRSHSWIISLMHRYLRWSRPDVLALPAKDGYPSPISPLCVFLSLALFLFFLSVCLSHPVNNSNERCQITPFKGSCWNVLNSAFSFCHVKSKP